MFAVFLARIEPLQPGVDEYLWVVVGDIPPAYQITDNAPTPKEALEGYIEEMRKWVTLANERKSSEDVIPVNVPATSEQAGQLEGRLNALEKEIISVWFKSSEDVDREQ